MAINKLQGKYNTQFSKKILVGTSFGGLTGLFVASQEANDNTLGISKYIFVCPPVEIFYALQQMDNFSQFWTQTHKDLKDTTATTAEKLVQVMTNDYSKDKTISLPFTNNESELAISFAMRQKLYDLVFTLEKGNPSQKNEIYDEVKNMSFYDYAQKYLVSKQKEPMQQLEYNSSLYAITDFLKHNNNYKIYHALDDCFTNPKQLSWLKNQTGNKTILFSNGSHLGFLYRNEFLNEFVKDTKLDNN